MLLREKLGAEMMCTAPATHHVETFKNVLHCKKELAVFPSPAGMSLIKLFLGGNNLVISRPERVWSVTSRLGTGKWLTLFYSVVALYYLDVDRRNSQASCHAAEGEVGG